MDVPKRVQLKEVGPRDGLQNENAFIPTAEKVKLIDCLSETGLDYIEVTSFVHPKWIPQLADAVDVLKAIKRNPNVTYAALVPNVKGLERALESNVDEVSIFMSASEGHNHANINKSIDETFPILKEVVDGALAAGKTVRGYISTVIACPYDGYTEPAQVLRIADKLFEMGVSEISLGDTIGIGVPTQVDILLKELLRYFKTDQLSMHFHDTRGTALANTVVSLMHGISKFDSAIGGLGGCPYAKGASGNVATEDLLYMLQEMRIDTGVQLDRITDAALSVEEVIGRKLSSKQVMIAHGGKQS
ncbi:hydroxymethylglutaryl-CoA lyase [Ureibacillus manganicus]|uniref:Hydroxymethylglutaryl-CoA lyase n=1 Tax=Ureibacillus manganicus DSM 26584 TaxID=1384049 RepID=A0A0A3HZL3_9BACL|nr:hydroxymethylglutaryl-CoA lyase [Ureibacillus manganicus]KGR76710.1 hydroxymethylglutaryl-CoA lyase [Ureibacillus manganicus DSM 26584]